MGSYKGHNPATIWDGGIAATRQVFCLVSVSLTCATLLWAGDPLEFRLTPAVRQYCQLVRFAQGWRDPIFGERGGNWVFDYSKDYEFRAVAGSRTEVLVAGLIAPGCKTPNVYTVNKYAFDLARPATSVRVASEAEWQAGSVISLGRKHTYYPYFHLTAEDTQPAQLNGLHFAKTGQHWIDPSHDADRLSPDDSWLVLQSISGRVDTRLDWDTIFLQPWRFRGKIFLDVFSALTGNKLLTIEAKYAAADGRQRVRWTAWLDRYFLIPLGERKERCLICDFSTSDKEQSRGPAAQ